MFEKKKISAILISIVLGIIVWVYVSSPLVITTTGTGEVTVPATNATISITLTANDQSPQTALSMVKQRVDTITELLKNRGVAPEDIAQSQITAVPAAFAIEGGQGFQATVTMGAKTTNVANISSIVSDLYASGAIIVSQPVLSVENQDELEQKALDEALKDAKKQAGKIALKNWKLIKKMVTLTSTSSGTTSTATTKADTLTGESSAQAAENGVFKIIKSVTVIYKLW